MGNPAFVLFVYDFGVLQRSGITWEDGPTEPVTVQSETADCRSFSYRVPTSRGQVTVDLTALRYQIGTPCAFGAAIAESSASPGGSGVAWVTAGR